MSQDLYRGTRGTVQEVSVQLPGQVKNIDGGGNYYVASDSDRIRRFLILGSTDGTYYQNAEKVSDNNIKFIRAMANDPEKYADLAWQIAEVSDRGLAYKNDPCIVALAELLTSNLVMARIKGEQIAPQVIRIGTHILHLASYVNSRRGWGRLVRRVFADWYNRKSDEALAYQMIKYQSRDGWAHADVIRLAHIKPNSEIKNELFRWAMKQPCEPPALVTAFDMANNAVTALDMVKLINGYRLEREMVPTRWYKDHQVLDALVNNFKMTAMLRNLGMVSSSGWLNSLDLQRIQLVLQRLPRERLQPERVHPLQILLASKTYANGEGRSGITWKPVQRILDHLDTLFEEAWQYAPKINKKILVALDVSGSMSMHSVSGITAAEGGACIVKQLLCCADSTVAVAFSDTLQVLPVSAKMSLNEVVKRTADLRFGATNPGLAMQWLLDRAELKDVYDGVIFISDNELNGGKHPVQLVVQYRKKYTRDFRVVSVNMTPTPSSMFPENDKLCLGVAGFDASICNIIANFFNGEI